MGTSLNPPSNAGDASSIPGQGTKIPYTTGQLSPHAISKEPVHNDDPTQPKQEEGLMEGERQEEGRGRKGGRQEGRMEGRKERRHENRSQEGGMVLCEAVG